VLVTLRHPLRRNSDWGWAPLDLRPASLEQLAAKVAEWPDAHVASAARAVRPEWSRSSAPYVTPRSWRC
jgi:hypothetical protein